MQHSAAVQPVVNWGDPRLPDRFWDKVSPCPVSGCWHWTGSVRQGKRTTTPVLGRSGLRSGSVRRAAHLAFFADTPLRRMTSGCGNDLCVNPSHAIECIDPGDKEALKIRAASYMREWKRKNREKHSYGSWVSKLRRLYNTDAGEISRMRAEQAGHCAICGAMFSSENPEHIDHCHKTGAVREILCRGCNLGLGGFRDSPSALRAAADYLERHAKKAV